MNEAHHVDLTGIERVVLLDRLQSSYAFGKTPPEDRPELETIITKLQKEPVLVFNEEERKHIEDFVSNYLKNLDRDNPVLKALQVKFHG